MNNKLNLTNTTKITQDQNNLDTLKVDSQTINVEDFIMVDLNVSHSNSDTSLANSSTRTINPDGTRTLNRGNFKTIESRNTLKVNRNKYVDYEIYHDDVIGKDNNVKYNKFTVIYGSRIRRCGDPTSRQECFSQAQNRRINNPVLIISKRLCNLVKNVPKEKFKSQVELFNYTLIEIIKFHGVKGVSLALTDEDAKKFINRAMDIIKKNIKAKKEAETSISSSSNSNSNSNSNANDVINIIETKKNENISESNSQSINLPSIEQKTQEIEEEIMNMEKETERLKEMTEALDIEISQFKKCKNKLEFLIKKTFEEQNFNDVTMLLKYDYCDETFPETLESFINNIRYITFTRNNSSGTKQESRTIAYTYDKKNDILCYGASVFRKAPSNLVSKNPENIAYNEDRGKAIARLRLIRTPVIVNSFSKTNLKKTYEITSNSNDVNSHEQYANLVSEAFRDSLLHYVCYGEKKYGCSNRKSNSKKDLKNLDKVISKNPFLYEELTFKNVPKNVSNCKTKQTKSLRSNLSSSTIGSSNSNRSSNRNKTNDIDVNFDVNSTTGNIKKDVNVSSYNMY